MKKLKIYLDTSVISYLDQQDSPERMAETCQLWEQIKLAKFDIVLSDLTLAEIDDCTPAKSAVLRGYVYEIDFQEIQRNDEAKRLSALYFEYGGLPPKSKDDAMHIALTTIADCDVILSWNFRHIVNMRAMKAVESVNILEGYRPLRILPPPALLEPEG